jgi:hypothetical protein
MRGTRIRVRRLPSCPPAYSENATIFALGSSDILVGLIVAKKDGILARGTDKRLWEHLHNLFFRLVDMLFMWHCTNVEFRAE